MVLISRGYVGFRDCILFNKCDNLWWHLKIQYLFCFSQFLQIWNPKVVLGKKTVSLQELKTGVQRFRKVYVYVDVYIYIYIYMIIKIKPSQAHEREKEPREGKAPIRERKTPNPTCILLISFGFAWKIHLRFNHNSSWSPCTTFFPLLHAGKPTFRKIWPGGLEWMTVKLEKTRGKTPVMEVDGVQMIFLFKPRCFFWFYLSFRAST